ncbi:MAG: hypothetical protein ACE361_16300 [Aureliella sp.]
MSDERTMPYQPQEIAPIRFVGFAVSLCVSSVLWGIVAYNLAQTNWWLGYYFYASGAVVLGGVILSLPLKKFQLRSQRIERLYVAGAAVAACVIGLAISNTPLMLAGALLSSLFSLSSCKLFSQIGLRLAPLLLSATVLWGYSMPAVQFFALRAVRTITDISLRTFETAHVSEPQRLIYQFGSFDYSLLAHNWHYYAAVFAAAIFLCLVGRDILTSLFTLAVACVTCLVSLSSFAIVLAINEIPVAAWGSPEFNWTTPALITLCGALFFLSAERLISVIFCPISAGHLGGKGNPLAAAWNAALQLGQMKPAEFNWWRTDSQLQVTPGSWPALVAIALAVVQLGCGIVFAVQSETKTTEYARMPDSAGPFLSSLAGANSPLSLSTPRRSVFLADQQLTETYLGHSLKSIYCDELLFVAGHRTDAQIASLLASRGLDLESAQVDFDSIESDQLTSDSVDVDPAANPKAPDVRSAEETPAFSFFAHHKLDNPEQTPITVCCVRTWYAPQSQTVLASARSELIRILKPNLGVERL